MKYDFDKICSRQYTNCVKWDAIGTIFGNEDVIPMWVADMDFPAANPVVDALKERAAHEFYGYTQPGPALIQSVVDRLQRKFGWRIQPEWIVFTPGVIPAISVAIRSLTRPGDGVILQEPVYYPFFPCVKQSGCQIVTNELKLGHGHYEIDFADLENKFQNMYGMLNTASKSKAIILCNPHNPIGAHMEQGEVVTSGGDRYRA